MRPYDANAETRHPMEETRDQIRAEALVLFGHFGFSKTSISDIAQACGMSSGNVYRFYRNKQAIGIAVVEDFFTHQQQLVNDARLTTDGPAEAHLRRAIMAGVGFLLEMMERNPRLLEMAEFLCADVDGLALLNEHRSRLSECLGAIIADGCVDGDFSVTDPVQSGWVVMLATKAFWMPQALIEWNDQDQILTDLDAVISLVLPALRTKPTA